MTAVAEPRTAPRIRPRAGHWRVAVASTSAQAADAWDRLEASGGAAGYQRRRFLEPWIADVAPAKGVLPALGIVSGPHGPVALLPFGVMRRGPLRVAEYLGGRDSNLNLPLLDPALMLTVDDATEILNAFCAALTMRTDLLVLSNQPRGWRGRANPFAFETSRPSPSNAYGATWGDDADAFLRDRTSRAAKKKLRMKAKHLAQLGPVSFARASSPETAALIEAFVVQKQSRLARHGVDAGLDNAGVRAFLNRLASPARGVAVLDLYVLRVSGEPAAIFGGLPDGDHWHGLINSYAAAPDLARCSPGDLLLRQAVSDLGRRGFRSFDLGIGEARYKSALCDETIELVDTIVPLTSMGYLFAAGINLRLATKGAIKRRPWALGAVRQLQEWLHAR